MIAHMAECLFAADRKAFDNRNKQSMQDFSADSFPKNFEVYIAEIVVGITEILKIGIKSTDSLYSGKRMGMIIGATNIPKIAKITEIKIAKILSLVFDFPLAS